GPFRRYLSSSSVSLEPLLILALRCAVVYGRGGGVLFLWCDVGNPGIHSSLDFINPSSEKTMNWFARIVAHHPYVILVAVAVFAGTCLIIPLTTKKPPDFSDPQLGFEARGTVLAQRLTAWKNLLDATGPSGPLVIDPRQIPTHIEIPRYNVSQNAISKAYETKEKGTVLAHKMTTWENQLPKVMQPVGSEVNSIPGFTRSTPSWMFSNTSEVLQDVKNNSDSDGDALKELEGFEKSGMDIVDHHHDHQHLSSDGFFCASPSIDYSRVVLQATDGRDLFTLESILSMCHIEAQLMTNEQFHSICESISHGRCCHSWSLGNYIASYTTGHLVLLSL
ncbi:hypothetical protein ANN_22906, partial [Periplaneta americana]